MALLKARKVIQRTVAEIIEEHMRAIKQQFPDGKLTLIVRSATLEGAIIFTNDDASEAIKAIQSHGQKRATTVVTH